MSLRLIPVISLYLRSPWRQAPDLFARDRPEQGERAATRMSPLMNTEIRSRRPALPDMAPCSSGPDTA
jgi:hypothetical protein